MQVEKAVQRLLRSVLRKIYLTIVYFFRSSGLIIEIERENQYDARYTPASPVYSR